MATAGKQLTDRTRRHKPGHAAALAFTVFAAGAVVSACGGTKPAAEAAPTAAAQPQAKQEPSPALVAEGKEIFRFDTFGDEKYWTDTLRMHEVIQKGVSPATALSVGLKVDADALPQTVKDALAAGQVDLSNPATTVTLLKLNAVVGLKGRGSNGQRPRYAHASGNHMRPVSFDGRQLVHQRHRQAPGRLAEYHPEFRRNHRPVAGSASGAQGSDLLNSWGPGEVRSSGQHRRAEHSAGAAARVWPARRRQGDLHGRRPGIVLERLRRGDANARAGQLQRPPARDRRSSTRPTWSPLNLPALRAYQHSLPAPPPPAGQLRSGRSPSAGARAVRPGRAPAATSAGPARTTTVRSAPPAQRTQASTARTRRAPATKAYRTTPLRGLWQHAPYFHDGSAATLADVVTHYNRVRKLGAHRRAAARSRRVPEVALRVGAE